jgi:hypothetical protein
MKIKMRMTNENKKTNESEITNKNENSEKSIYFLNTYNEFD